MVVYYRKIYNAVRIFRHHPFVNATCEPNFVRDKAGGEVRVQESAISPVIQVEASNPVVRELWLHLVEIVQEHVTRLFVIVYEKNPLVP